MRLSNMTFAAAFAALFLVVGCSEGDIRTLRIYTWSDYIAPSVVKRFEKAHGVKVLVDTFESNEAMYAKLKSGEARYDIIVPSSYQIATMVREGMVARLDHSRLPNVRRNFDPSFVAQIIDPSFTYSVPYAVTYTGFAYEKDMIPEGADVASWSILGNETLKGRITMLDDEREVIGAGLMYLGLSINSTRRDEIEAAVGQVLKWRENVGKFDSESYKNEIASGAIWLGQGYSTDIAQIIAGDVERHVSPRTDIGFALPDEGFAIAFDEMVIPVDASSKDLAYEFIDYLYEGDVAAENMGYICGPMPVAPGIAQLDDDFRALIMLDAESLRKGQVIKSFYDKPGVQALYDAAWARIKAADAR